MKIRLRLCHLALAFIALAVYLDHSPVKAQGLNDPGFNPGAFQPMMATNIPSMLPGRTWVEAKFADRGLGFEGSYVTLGGRTHLFEDFLDGRWLAEARGHMSLERGGLFSNVGIERVFSIPAAGADVSAGAWWDYDDDSIGNFGSRFHAVGISTSIKTQRWDVYGNGYIPVGTTDRALGDPTGVNPFLNHGIVVQAGIDSALRGFDAMFRVRPEALGRINGSVEVGGYTYNSDLVDSFAGVRVRGGMQLMRGLLVNAEVNHDDRFKFTGFLSVGLAFGGSARGTSYGMLGRDLESTVRNDHIVRYQQDMILAVNPNTGLPFTVWHVDNLADPAFADGRYETPFTNLADAETASGAHDIIFVRPGDGTVRNLDTGIALKDGQFLLGDGVQHLLPVAGGEFFQLIHNLDGNLPRLTNRFAGPIVGLSNNNTVRGLILDGNAPGAFVSNAIQSAGGFTHTDGLIEDVTIIGPLLHGISLNNIAGDWRFARNTISEAGLDGIFIANAGDPTSRFEFVQNTVFNNLRDGIHMEDYDGDFFLFDRNDVNNNFRHGIRMERFVGTGGIFEFLSPVVTDNIANGISIVGADGNLRILNASITGNSASGVQLTDFTTTNPAHSVFIGTSAGGVSNISGNGTGSGANVSIVLNSGVQRATITDTLLDDGGSGVFARASGIGTLLDLAIIENTSINNSVADGIRLIADDGASLFAVIQNTNGPLDMIGSGDNALTFLVGSDSGGALASLEVFVRNLNIQGAGQTNIGVFGDSRDDGQLSLDIANTSIIGVNGTGMVFNIETNPTLAINTVRADNMTITGMGGGGVTANVGPDSFFDFILTNSTLSGGATGNGILVNATGGAGVPIDDNRTRLLIQDNSITDFLLNGISINTFGDARLLATLDGNVITGNGPGVEDDELPFFHGVQVTAAEESVINILMQDNQITGNFEQGLAMTTLDTGFLNAVLINNAIHDNDIGESATVPPQSGLLDMSVTNSTTGNVNLAMSNNFFQLPAVVTNLGGAASFILELDGVTNGLGVPVIVGAVTPSPFSVVTIPTFDAEVAAFEAAGFPPQ